MSEIAKCPLCGKDVKKSIWRPEYEGCAGSVVITVKCCGMEALTVELWNRYAAAMELVKRHKDLDNYKGVNPNIITDLVNAITVAEHNVLEVFK